MKHAGLLIVALVLIGVGVLGLLVTEAVRPLAVYYQQAPGSAGSSAARGQRIYRTGLSASGQPIPRTTQPLSQGALMMGGGGCASCHGGNGRGRTFSMMGDSIEAPDITYGSLTDEGYTDTKVYRAIRYGIDENGAPLDPSMPRWQMTDTELADVLAYLKELSPR
jgi:cytochrome c oxidase subunit II